MPRPARRPASGPAVESAPSLLEPRSWQGISYRPCQAGAPRVRDLFQFAGAWTPAVDEAELAWEALAGERLVGGVLVERRGPHGLTHGPVVVDPPSSTDALEVAAQLVAALLSQVKALSLDTLFARPQGLDRVWVRLGFVPVPEAFLPEGLRGRPGSGLHAWRRPGTYAIPTPQGEGERGGRGRR